MPATEAPPVQPTPAPVASAPITSPRPVTLGERAIPLPPPAERKLYELGVKGADAEGRACPVQNFSVCGVTFHAVRGTPVMLEDGNWQTPPLRGKRDWLTDAERDAIVNAISHKVARVGTGDTGRIYDDRSSNYHPQSGDVRLARFLWLHELPESEAREVPEPVSMAG